MVIQLSKDVLRQNMKELAMDSACELSRRDIMVALMIDSYVMKPGCRIEWKGVGSLEEARHGIARSTSRLPDCTSATIFLG